MTTGLTGENGPTDNSEIIDLQDADNVCNDYLPANGKRIRAYGGLINDKNPLICAGSLDVDDCYFLGKPEAVATMKLQRVGATEIVEPGGQRIWLTGVQVYDGITGITNTTEIVEPGKETIDGPVMPDRRENHCLVELDPDTFLFIGGFTEESGETPTSYIFHGAGSQTFESGPKLSKAKLLMSCQTLEATDGDDRIVVVAGGSVNDEIETWTIGSPGDFSVIEAKLPLALWAASSIVTDIDGENAMVLIGGYTFQPDPIRSNLLKITCRTASDCQVEEMEQRLKVGRYDAVSMLIPDSLANCTRK